MTCCHETLVWVGIAVPPYDDNQVRQQAEQRLRDRTAARRRELTGTVQVVIDTDELGDRCAVVVAVAPSAPAAPTKVRPSGEGLWAKGEVEPL